MAVVLAVVFLVAAQARVQQLQIGAAFCKQCRMQAPYPEVASGIAASGYRGAGTIVADDAYLAGNLRVQFPAARVLAARHPSFRPPASGATGQCLLVWHAEFEARMPARLRRFAERVLGLSRLDQAPVAYLEAKVLGTGTPIAPRRNIRIAYVMPRGSAGPCG